MFSEIFRPICTGCGKNAESGIFCNECNDKLAHFENFCEKCGHPLKIKAVHCAFCFLNKYNKLYTDYIYGTPIKELLKKIKFSYGVRDIFFIKDMILKDGSFFANYDIITPVPSHYTRKFRRIVHPADVLAKRIAFIGETRFENLIVRRKKTGYQWKLKKKQRIKNVNGAFAINGNCFDKKVLIVDDIYTTGSTVNECAKVLRKNGAKLVDVYTLSCTGYY